LRERYRDDPLTYSKFDPDLWMEVGSSGGPDKNRVYELSNTIAENLRATVVFQSLGAPNQYRAPNLRSSWPCSNTRLSSPKKYDHLLAAYSQLEADNAQQKAEYDQLREFVMNMASQSDDRCAPPPFWSYNNQPPPSPPAPPLC